MADNVMFEEAKQAVRQGQRSRGRDLLTRLLRADPNNPEYWLWMSAVVDSTKERAYCLQMVDKFDPGNPAARRGLILTGAALPSADAGSGAFARRKWNLRVTEPPKEKGLKRLIHNPILRTASFAILAVVVGGLILAGISASNASRQRRVAIIPTQTPGPAPTFTPTPTLIGQKSTPTPARVFGQPTPLALLLNVQYTPTPMYVNTPHPVVEAYRMGQRALERDDLKAALDYYLQAGEMAPDAADIQFQIGEIRRRLGENDLALAAYQRAIEIDEGFAPAFLGRALVTQAEKPGADIGKDLEAAIARDPNYAEAYLARAAYLIQQGDPEQALEDLEIAGELLPDTPWALYYEGQIALLAGETKRACELAEEANRRERTFLPAYLLWGECAMGNEDYATAVEALKIYTTYVPEEAKGWALLGIAQVKSGADSEEALAALETALAINQEKSEAYYYRGSLYLELGEGQKAINDFVVVRRLDRKSFAASLGLARALFDTGRVQDAWSQMNLTLELAEADAERAEGYYWRAQILEAAGEALTARRDWQALLDLPKKAAPEEWREAAENALRGPATPTLTPTLAARRE
jgi:tetratricopeptide (TPR) repeat protein